MRLRPSYGGFYSLKMPAAGHSQVVQMDGALAVVLGILLHCIQKADASLKAPLEVLPVQKPALQSAPEAPM